MSISPGEHGEDERQCVKIGISEKLRSQEVNQVMGLVGPKGVQSILPLESKEATSLDAALSPVGDDTLLHSPREKCSVETRPSQHEGTT